MPTVPETRLGKIEFYESHNAPWTANAAAIGLTPASVTALGVLTTAARNAYNAHVAAQAAAKAATQVFYDKVRAMHSGTGAGAAMLDTIRAYAVAKGDPGVYSLAQIPPPATPGTTPPPGTPSNFIITLHPTGAIELKWKCLNPPGTSGTVYEVRRRIGASGAYTFLGSNGTRSFVDDTLPTSAASAVGGVSYEITAVRSTARGIASQVTVNFGQNGSGLTVTESVRIAA